METHKSTGMQQSLGLQFLLINMHSTIVIIYLVTNMTLTMVGQREIYIVVQLVPPGPTQLHWQTAQNWTRQKQVAVLENQG